jgi:N-acetylglucosaminyldiphosphoundecaprenol N-acetyl-beta-D-mannosaminyltransferase
MAEQWQAGPGASAIAEALPTITILGVPVHVLTYDGALARIGHMIASRQPHQIVTVNPEFLVLARREPAFRAVLSRADLALPDGVGLQLAALLQGRRFVSRVPGSELVYRLAPLAEARGWRLFLLGAGPGVAQRAAENLRRRYPALGIEADGADPTPEGTAAALEHIQRAQPDILLVAYGAPTQDLWIAAHGAAAGVPVMMGVGGTLDFLAGVVPRPPHLLHRLGLEWLYRLIRQPWRWRRQLRLPAFLVLVVAERLQAPVGRRPRNG